MRKMRRQTDRPRGLTLLLLTALALATLSTSCRKEEKDPLPVENTAWRSAGIAERPWVEGTAEDNEKVPYPEEITMSWEEFANGKLPNGKHNKLVSAFMSESPFVRVMQGTTLEFGTDHQAKTIFEVMIYEDWFRKTKGKMLRIEFPCRYYKEGGRIVIRDFRYNNFGNMFHPKYAEFLALNQKDFVEVFNAIAGLIVVQSVLLSSPSMGMPFKYMNGKYLISPRVETSVINASQTQDPAAMGRTVEKLAQLVGSREEALRILQAIAAEMSKDSYCLYLARVQPGQ